MSGRVQRHIKRLEQNGIDVSSIPANMGKTWSDDEVLQLLQNIRKKKSFEEIAVEHQRSVGGVMGRLRQLAADYHNEGRPIEQIEKFTGLTAEEINDTVERRRIGEANREKRKLERTVQTKLYAPVDIEPTMSDLMVILKDIRSIMIQLLESQV